MTPRVKVWKVSLLLLLGLFAFLYIVVGSGAEVYHLVTSPVAGFYYDYVEESGKTVVLRVVPSGPADASGLQANDVILALNDTRIQKPGDVAAVFKNVKVGDSLELLVARGGDTRKISLVTQRRLNVYTKAIFLLLLPGIVFCYALFLIGIFVLLNRIHDRTAHLFYLMLIFWALAMRTTYAGDSSLHEWLPGWFYWLLLPSWPLAVGLMLHFFLIFPVHKKTFQRYPRLILALIYSPLTLAALFIYGQFTRQKWSEDILNIGWGIWLSAFFFVALGVLYHSFKNAPNPHVRKQAQIVLTGTSLSLGIPLVLSFVPLLLFKKTLPFSEFYQLLIIMWPVTLAYAIIKHRFMNIDVIIKRGVAYALTSGVIVAAYFLLVVGAGKLVLFLVGSTSQVTTIVATLIIAASFNPVKRNIQKFVDRRFYPSRFVFREAVQALGHKLVSVMSLQKLLELLFGFFTESLHVKPVALLWLDEDKGGYAVREATNLKSASEIRITDNDNVVRCLLDTRQLVDLSPLKEKPGFLSPDEKRRWEQLQAECVLPLLSKGKLVGMLSLGIRSADEPYYKDDLDVLRALGDQVNISLDNAVLTEELREQERLKHELEVARRIQLSSLPASDPKIAGLEISGISLPALEVGGDYYDYIQFADGRPGVVVGDVSGKGTSAALYMSQLKGILLAAAKHHRSLRDLMVEVNAVTYCNIELQSFITLVCGSFDLEKRKFSVVRAGHLPLIHFSAKDRACRLLEPRGIGIGLENGEVFDRELRELEVSFDHGDVILFYTDGIVEARNSRGQELETGFLLKMIQENGHTSASSLRDAIISRVQEFTAQTTTYDDMTLVVVKIDETAAR